MAKNCHCKYASGNNLTLSEEIGVRLRQLRAQAGLTQDQLAEKLGVSKRTQGNYESGASDPPASYRSMAASQLGFDVGKGVTKKTNYLVKGQQDLAKLNGKSISSKEEKALSLIKKGQDIVVISEDDFFYMIGT